MQYYTHMRATKIIPVILCGGSGTKLWPLSREGMPKQFLSLLDEKSLLQNTVLRAQRASNALNSEFVYVTLANSERELSNQLVELGNGYNAHILCEPMARNTAAAVALASAYVAETFGDDAYMWVLPADHHIADENALQNALHDTMIAAGQGYLATFGILPTRPDTGYGYIHFADEIVQDERARHVAEFVEKPNLETAQTYLNDGQYLWNSGMFVFQAKTILENYAQYAPHILDAITAQKSSGYKTISTAAYLAIESAPFDTAIMEKTDKVAVVPCSIGWSDIGSWESIWDISDKDTSGNVVEGTIVQYDSHDCMIYSQDRLVAVAGIRDIVVIETGDSVLIADKSNSDALKSLVDDLKKQGSSETKIPTKQSFPWGSTKILSKGDDYLVNKITVKPGYTTPYVVHHRTSKSWVIIDGQADIVMDNYFKSAKAGDTLKIPVKTVHHATNTGDKPLRIIETQYRTNFKKDDVVIRLNARRTQSTF